MNARKLTTELFLELDEDDSDERLRCRAARALRLPAEDVTAVRIVHRALDVRRGRRAGHHLRLEVFLGGIVEQPAFAAPRFGLPRPARVVIAGSGPAGTFAALRLARAGARVTICELGKPIQRRRHDVAALTRDGALDPSSNYCFGEGGAGTFSDGKLYTRTIKKQPEAVNEVLRTLVQHGAHPSILVESRAHVGSDRLPRVLLALRADLEALGATYRFSDPLVDFGCGPDGAVRLARLASGVELPCERLILAVGHSARALFETLVTRRQLACAPKPFAVGVRVEHPQALIDEIQYGRWRGSPRLPAAFYQLTASVEDGDTTRGVYSFCMCPGGYIVDSSTEAGRLCTNGMSLARRDSPLANAALVVTVGPRDVAPHGRHAGDPLAGVAFQRELEARAFARGGGGFVAPAQRLTDFVARRASSSTLRSSYRPGVAASDLHEILPPSLSAALRAAIPLFERTMRGFFSAEAQLVGVETRTSSPLRLLRDPVSLQSPSHPGVYPCAEGAGHAGGIVSSAVDGLRVAEAVVRDLDGWRTPL